MQLEHDYELLHCASHKELQRLRLLRMTVILRDGAKNQTMMTE